MKLNASPQISIILPAYNEKESLMPLIGRIHDVLTGHSYEIIVVDDDSPDGTFSALSDKGDPCLRVFKRSEERSLAKSIAFGIERSCGEVIIVMDSDGNHDPVYIPQLLLHLENYDLVSASRFMHRTGSLPARFQLSRMFNGLISFLFQKRFSDYLYGYFAVKRGVIAAHLSEDIFFGYGDYYFRLLLFLDRKGYSIKEIPARNAQRIAGRGNTHLVAAFIRYFNQLIRWTLRVRMQNV